MSEFVTTVAAICPECVEPRYGHIHRVPGAGVCGWRCPSCGTTEDPNDLEVRTPEAPESLLGGGD